jgi:hypothetical protein
VNASETQQQTTGTSRGSSIRDKWLNPRRKRFWAIVAILIYSLSGYYLAPILVEKSIINAARDDLGREAVIRKTRVNPYLLTLRIQGFEIKDRDNVRLAGFSELFVDFELSSLFRRAWTFREISLKESYFFFERFETGDSRLSRVLADASGDDAVETPDDSADGLPRLLIHSIRLSEGSGDLVDNVPPTPFKTHLGSINIEIHELSTLPDLSGDQAVTIQLENGETLSWQGSLSLAPFHSEGELVLSDSRLDQTIAYLKAILPLESMSASLSARFDYRVHMDPDDGLDIDIDDIDVELKDLAITGLEPATDFLALSSMSLSGGTLRYPEQKVQFSTLEIDQPGLVSWLDADGAVSLSQLVPQQGDDTGANVTDDAGSWDIGIDEVTVNAGNVSFTDRSIQPAAAVNLQGLQLGMDGISNTEGASFPVRLSGGLESGGNFTVEGNFSFIPDLNFTAMANTAGIPLSLGQPYAQKFARIEIREGTVDSNLEISLQQGNQFTVGGEIDIPALDVFDMIENKRLLGWTNLNIDRFDLDPGSRSLHLSKLAFEAPFARLVILENRTTNLSGLIIDGEQSATETDANENPVSIIIGHIAVRQGAMDFSDLSLPLPFTTSIAKLDGTISTISTVSTEPSNIHLEGQVNEFGLARIQGTMNLLDPIQHTGVSVEFRNLLMSRLSPYTVQFAGQEIDEGKLDLDLGYFIDNGQLKGQNDIILSDLVLGEKVEHPDAANLPLELAVALLKDADGVIDIDLPVEGDINDPEFQIDGIVLQAISNLITNIVSAPFRLLGNLLGIDSEDLGQFQFLAGRSDLTPPEVEKISQLGEALQQRPELTVEISGATDPGIDIPALQYQHLRKTVIDRLGDDSAVPDEKILMVDVEVRKILEALFLERFPETPLESLKAGFMAPPANDSEAAPELDVLAYSGGLRDRLLESEVIDAQDLEALATARAEAIHVAFLAGGTFDESRIVIAEPGEAESEDGEWVVMELGVASN